MYFKTWRKVTLPRDLVLATPYFTSLTDKQYLRAADFTNICKAAEIKVRAICPASM